jgi:hypothetical protein
MTRTITSFKHYRLGVKNLNKLVIIMKTKQMIQNLGALLGRNQLMNISRLKMAWCRKMKISLLISICLKKTNDVWCFWVHKKFWCIICEK